MARRRNASTSLPMLVIGALRSQARISQTELARRVGTHQPTISAYEAGHAITDGHAVKILEVFKAIPETADRALTLSAPDLSRVHTSQKED